MPFSRGLGGVAWGIAWAAALSGCSLKSGESPAASPYGSVEVGSSARGCLTGGSLKLKRYFKGESNPGEVTGLLDCVSTALKQFSELTEGQVSGQYRPGELRSFLNYYFISGSKISSELMSDLMELKSALVGGRSDSLSTLELERARQLIQVLKEQALRLQPYVPFDRDHIEKMAPERLDEAMAVFQSVAERIGAKLEETGVPYSFSRMQSLVVRLEPYFDRDPKDPEDLPLPQYLKDKIQGLAALKGILIGQGSERINGGEWQRALGVGAQVFGLDRKLMNARRSYPSLERGPGLQRLKTIAWEARGILEEAVRRQPRQAIEFSSLETLVDSLSTEGKFKLAGTEVEAVVVKKTIPALVQRVFGGSDGGEQGRAARGVTLGLIQRVWAGFDRWSRGQAYVEAAFLRAARSIGWSGDPEKLFDSAGFSPSQLFPRSEPGDVENEMRWIAMNPKAMPMFAGPGGIIQLQRSSGEDRRYSFQHFSRLNWMRQLARVVLPGYVDDPVRLKDQSGITLEELKRFVDDIVELGVQIKFIDPRKKDTVHLKRFREANVFTLSANGDGRVDLMSLDETSELLAFMLSAKGLAEKFHEPIAELCFSEEFPDYRSALESWRQGLGPKPAWPKGRIDLFNRPLIPVKCFWSKFFDCGIRLPSGSTVCRTDDALASIPGLKRTLATQRGAGQGPEVEEILKGVVTTSQFDPQWIDSSDSETFAGILQYAETAFTRFDVNDSDWLEEPEINAAFDVFAPLMSELTRPRYGDLDRDTLNLIYTYMLYYGEVPTKGNVRTWYFTRWLKTIKADRIRVLEVFREIGKINSSSSSSGAPQVIEKLDLPEGHGNQLRRISPLNP